MRYTVEELFPLIKDLTDKYTSKSSTSVPYETAQKLMEAILYCINEAESDTGDKDLEMLKEYHSTVSARESYQRGYELIIRKTKNAQDLYNQIAEDFSGYGNYFYEKTVLKDIPVFFKYYDVRFSPQENVIDLEYPVLCPLTDKHGINLISDYLDCIWLEQKFLNRLPSDYVQTVLRSGRYDHQNDMINVCGIVLRKILVNMLLKISLQQIQLGKEDYSKVISLVKESKSDFLRNTLYEQLKILTDKFYDEDSRILEYMKCDIPDITAELVNAAENQCLDKVI